MATLKKNHLLAVVALLLVPFSHSFDTITMSGNVTCPCLSYVYGVDYDCLEKYLDENGPLSKKCMSILRHITCGAWHSDSSFGCQDVNLQQFRTAFELVSDGFVDCSRDTFQIFQLKADHELTSENYDRRYIPTMPMELQSAPHEQCMHRFHTRPKFKIMVYKPQLYRIFMRNYNDSNIRFQILLTGHLKKDNALNCQSETEGAPRSDYYLETSNNVADFWLNIDYEDGMLEISTDAVPRCSYDADSSYPEWFQEFAFSFAPMNSSWEDNWNLGTWTFSGSERAVLKVSAGYYEDYHASSGWLNMPSGLQKYLSKTFDIRPQQNVAESEKLNGFRLHQSRSFSSTILLAFSWRCNHKILPGSASKISPRNYEIHCKILTDSDIVQPEECSNCFLSRDQKNCSLCWNLAVFQKVLGPKFRQNVPSSVTHSSVVIQRRFPNITDGSRIVDLTKVSISDSTIPIFQYDYYNGKYSGVPGTNLGSELNTWDFKNMNLAFDQHLHVLEKSIVIPGPFDQPRVLDSADSELMLLCKVAAKYETNKAWSDLIVFPSKQKIHPVKLIASFVGTFSNDFVHYRSTHFIQLDQERAILSTDFDDQILTSGGNTFHGFYHPAVDMSQTGPVSIKEPFVDAWANQFTEEYGSLQKRYSDRKLVNRVACFHWTFERWYAFVETENNNEYVLSFNDGGTGDLRWNEVPWKHALAPSKGIPVVIKCPQLHAFIVWSVTYSEQWNEDLEKFGKNNITFQKSYKTYSDWETHVYMLNLHPTTGLPSGDPVELHSSDLCGDCSTSNSTTVSPYFDVLYPDTENPSLVELVILCGETVCRNDFKKKQERITDLVGYKGIIWLAADLNNIYYLDGANPIHKKYPEFTEHGITTLTSRLRVVPFGTTDATEVPFINEVYRNGKKLRSFDNFDTQYIEAVHTYSDATSLPVPVKDCMFPMIKFTENPRMIQEGTMLVVSSSSWSSTCNGLAKPKIQYRLKYGVILQNITFGADATRWFNCSILTCLQAVSEPTSNASHEFVIGNLIADKNYYLELSALPAISLQLYTLWFPNTEISTVHTLSSSAYVPPSKEDWTIGLAIGLPILLATLVLIAGGLWFLQRQKMMYRTLTRITANEIKRIKKIGEGNFGEVWTAEYRKKETVVVKTLKESASEKEEREFRDEALLLSKFQHENIVKCIGICLQSRPIMVALEFIQGGSLASYLHAADVQLMLPVKMLIHVVYEVAKGCEYLEKQGYIHRDLAARNVLVSTDLKQVKITDFGMAKDIGVGCHYKVRLEDTIPVAWTPPEGFSGHFSSKSDIWSFGILVWEVFTWASTPYGPCCFNSTDEHSCSMTILSQNQIEFEVCVQKKSILDISHPCSGHLCEALANILRLCFKYDPEDRPSFSQLLHFINGASKSIEAETSFQKPKVSFTSCVRMLESSNPKAMTPAYSASITKAMTPAYSAAITKAMTPAYSAAIAEMNNSHNTTLLKENLGKESQACNIAELVPAYGTIEQDLRESVA